MKLTLGFLKSNQVSSANSLGFVKSNQVGTLTTNPGSDDNHYESRHKVMADSLIMPRLPSCTIVRPQTFIVKLF